MKHRIRVFKLITIILILINSHFVNAQDSTELWSISSLGGPDGLGQIIKMNLNGSEISKVNDFTTIYPGSFPNGNLCQAFNGKLYGTTCRGGKNQGGVIFCFDPVTKNYEKIFDFEPIINGFGNGTLLEVANGKLYGMTQGYGNYYNNGFLYSFDLTTNVFSKLFDFDSVSGKFPTGSLIKASNGLLYGMTTYGGANDLGVLFSFNINNDVYSKLFDLDSINGANPLGSLIQANDGNIYGMTFVGGVFNKGVIFKFEPETAAFSKIFDFNGSNGSTPRGDLMQASNGKLYGTTSSGGTYGAGTIFSFDLSTSTHNKLVDLSSNSDVIAPNNSFIQAGDGKLYSTIISGNRPIGGGGGSPYGGIFSFDITSNSCSRLFNFDYTIGGPPTNGGVPNGLILVNNGKLYGTTSMGGSTMDLAGVLYSWDIMTSTFEKHLNFNVNYGASPTQRLSQGANGKLYGMATNGGSKGWGVIYSIDPVTNIYADLHNFDETNGSLPTGSLIRAEDGKFYGMTLGGGGTSGNGIIFSFDPSSNTFRKIFGFDQIPQGGAPNGSLIQATNGLLYGMYTGGRQSNDYGAIFSFDPNSNTYTGLHLFDVTNGAYPYGSLCQASDGKLYGMTMRGGPHGIDCNGVIFSFDPTTNIFYKLADIDSALGITCDHTAMQGSMGAFVQAGNGKLYGTTYGGGIQNNGILFNFDPFTNITTKLIEFDGVNGSHPNDRDYQLTLSTNGNLFGKTLGGGINGKGVIFNYDVSADTITTLINYGQIGNINRLEVSASSNDSIKGGTIEIPVKGISIALKNTYSCSGQAVNVSVTIGYRSVCNTGNLFTAQLSDSTGNFDRPLLIGTFSSKTSGIIKCIVPDTIPESKGYKIRVISSAPNFISNSRQIFIKNGAHIISQPVSLFAALGSTALFNISAVGSGINYQWKQGSISLINGSRISGANTNSLNITSLIYSDSSINYNCIVSDSVGCFIKSSNVILGVAGAVPTITIQPAQLLPICEGSSISFSVGATGGGLSYQWYKGTTALYDSGKISGASTSIITINNVGTDDMGSYKVVASNIFGNITSESISISLNSIVTINSQPEAYQITCLNGNFSLSVGATGTGLQYHWKKGTTLLIDGTTSTNSSISGSLSSTLTIQNITTANAGTYSCVVKGTCSTITTGSSIVVIGLPPVPGFISGPLDLCNYAGTGQTFIYTIRKTIKTNQYKWTLPNGIYLDSTYGSLQNDTIIRVRVMSSFISGLITVQAQNSCGLTASRSLTIYKRVATQPVAMQQDFTPSIPAVLKVCGVSSTIYKIRKANYASSYIWSFNHGNYAVIYHLNPPGINDTAIQVNFLSGFTKDTLSVKSVNVCSISATRTLISSTINIPPVVSAISGSLTPCIGDVLSYTASALAPTSTQGATSVYRWTIPNYTTIVSASPDSATINISFNVGLTGGKISAKGQTSCGILGTAKTISLKYLPTTPSAISSGNGLYNACIGDVNTFTVVVPAPGITQNLASVYRWTIPRFTSIVSATTDSQTITLQFLEGYTGANISVKCQTTCAVLGAAKSQALTLSICPLTTRTSPIIVNTENNEEFSPTLIPNPTKNYFIIKLNSSSKDKVIVNIYDALGKKMISEIIPPNTNNYFGNKLPPGVYFIEVKQGVNRSVLKGIKY